MWPGGGIKRKKRGFLQTKGKKNSRALVIFARKRSRRNRQQRKRIETPGRHSKRKDTIKGFRGGRSTGGAG